MQINTFVKRHIGPRNDEVNEMIKVLGLNSVNELIIKTIPDSIRINNDLNVEEALTESEYLEYVWNDIASANKIYKSYIGLGYYNTYTPSVIKRNILENPSWYTSYTPYQAEISQGRLEALLNFQTVVAELTGLELANASMLDESTAAAEAMVMLFNSRSRDEIKNGINRFIVDQDVFPQTKAVLETRAEPLGIDLQVQSLGSTTSDDKAFGAIIQYPGKNGEIEDLSQRVKLLKEKNIRVAVATDLMALTLLASPGSCGADVAVGSSQRFGVPMGYGGPHAGFFAAREEFKRFMPGRIIGITIDRHGNKAYRMALQTREQHIKRERATSNICTAQALLATMAGMYAVYHGPEGLKEIATYIHSAANMLSSGLQKLGFQQTNKNYFDTICIRLPEGIKSLDIEKIARTHKINFRYPDESQLCISLDETIKVKELNAILEVFGRLIKKQYTKIESVSEILTIDKQFLREDAYLQHPVFNLYRSETELMRYIKKLERKDFSLTHSMISLGSCTMKLNAAAEMIPLSWPEFAEIHPFVPVDQAMGYQKLFHELGEFLKSITGFPGISFQPNSGAAGEHTGLLVIRAYQKSMGEAFRNVVLIPASAHGTNPASAVMAGMQVVVVACDENGNINMEDLKAKAEKHRNELSAFMVTYPSTHGVFEDHIKEMNELIHNYGGQVYMDGANMNAQVGYTSPAEIGADVCHLNLHKTFAIPHGGGGPGVGPICVAEHLIEFLPAHPLVETGGVNGLPAIASAPWGSASILVISHAYCKLLGKSGLKEATKFAILNANYIAARLKGHYKTLYSGKNGFVAHEMILDCREFKKYGITETDIAKRLMDYGFHAPTLSFPVHGTLMVEPTESESKQELDRFVEAMIAIRDEIRLVENGTYSKENNPLVNSPHTDKITTSDQWEYDYSRKTAGYPLDWIAENKFWPSIGRVNDAYGDRNLCCSIPAGNY